MMTKIKAQKIFFLFFGFFGLFPILGPVGMAQEEDMGISPLIFNEKNLSRYLQSSSMDVGEKIEVPTHLGRQMMEHLKSSLVTASTTSCRKEQKGVVDQRTWRMIQHDLKRGYQSLGVPSIPMIARDALPSGGKNSTITFYGKGAIFPNDTTQTNFILRTRFYTELQTDPKTGVLKTIKRSSTTNTNGWMEIKVRNPSPEEVLGVNKYRVKVEDGDILAIFASDPQNNAYAYKKLIENVKARAKLNPENKAQEVEAFFDIVYEMGLKDRSFISPQMVVSYERTAYKHIENNYHKKEHSKKRLRDDEPEASPANGPNIEYQITVDDNVTYYRPQIDLKAKDINLTQYYKTSTNGDLILAKFPTQAKAVEFKDPFPVANFGEEERSETHQFFYDDLMDPIHSEGFVLPGFIPNKGKAGHFRKFKTQGHKNKKQKREN